MACPGIEPESLAEESETLITKPNLRVEISSSWFGEKKQPIKHHGMQNVQPPSADLNMNRKKISPPFGKNIYLPFGPFKKGDSHSHH